ncbi:hypothetical protein DFH09DRAFT_1366596 [Mycena vulgaris]|nr:hypothetical protein DFH09DRAFT_1366596 [Mycena vulgaris]
MHDRRSGLYLTQEPEDVDAISACASVVSEEIQQALSNHGDDVLQLLAAGSGLPPQNSTNVCLHASIATAFGPNAPLCPATDSAVSILILDLIMNFVYCQPYRCLTMLTATVSTPSCVL